MARLFDGSTDFLDFGSAPMTMGTCTMVCWAQDDSGSNNDRELITFGDGNNNTDNLRLTRAQGGSNNISATQVGPGGGASEVTTTAAYSTNTWFHAAAVFASPADRTIYLDGGNSVNDTTDRSNWPTGVDEFRIGSEMTTTYPGTGIDWWSGPIAEVALWDVALTAAEIAMLGAGYSPLFVRANNLVLYAPMNDKTGAVRDLISGTAFTDRGTTADFAHPPIIYPRPQRIWVPPAVAGNITRDPGAGTLTLTGEAPTIATNVAMPAGSATFTGLAPTVVINNIIAVPAGSLTITGFAPTVEISHVALPDAGTLTITGEAPSVEITHIRDPPVGSLTLTGFAPTVNVTQTVLPDAGSLTLTGFAPTVERSWVVEPPAGTLNATGLAPTVERSWVIEPPTGSLTFTGLEPVVDTAGNRLPGAGSLTFTGYAPTVEISHVAQPGTGSLTFTGLAPTVEVTQTALPGAGSLTLTGFAPTVERSWVVEPPAGSLTFTGQEPIVDIAAGDIERPIPAGSLTLTGYAPEVINTGVVVAPARKGGRSRAKKKYVVTVDGQHFIFETIVALQAFLAEIRQTVTEEPEKLAAVEKAPVIRIRTGTGKIPTSKTVEKARQKTQVAVNKAVENAKQSLERDREISRLIRVKIREEDEEDAIVALLLS